MNASGGQRNCHEWVEFVKEAFATTFKSAPPLTDVTGEQRRDGCTVTVRLRNGDVKTLLVGKSDVGRFGENTTRIRIEAWIEQFRVVTRDLAEYNREGVVCPLCGTIIRPGPQNTLSDPRSLRWLSEPCKNCGTQISMRSPALWTF